MLDSITDKIVDHATRIPASVRDAINIWIFGDMQEGNTQDSKDGGFQKEAWLEFKHQFKTTPGINMALGLGDYGDWLRPTMMGRLKSALAGDDSAHAMLDDMVIRGQDALIKDMGFLEGKLIGLHEGHHKHEFMTGGTSTQRLASALKSPFLGWIASHRIVIEKEKSGTHLSYTMISTHGNANSRAAATALNWMTNNIASSFIADHYIFGHGCKHGAYTPFQREIIRREGPAGRILQIPRVIMVGGFSKGYTDGWHTSYVEKAGYSPQPLGWGLIKLRMTRRGSFESKGIPRNGRDKACLTLAVEQKNIHPLIDPEIYSH